MVVEYLPIMSFEEPPALIPDSYRDEQEHGSVVRPRTAPRRVLDT